MMKLAEEELSGESQKWLALLFGVLGFLTGNFYHDTLTTVELWLNPLWFLHDDDAYIFSFPGLIHGVVAVLLVAPLYIRKVLRYRSVSVASLLLLISNIYLFSTWIQLATGVQGGFSNTTVSMGVAIAIILSWLGMRSLSGFCWIIIVFLCAYNMVNGAEMLASWGVFFLLSSIVSIWMQTKMPLDEYFSCLKGEFSYVANGSLCGSMKEDVDAAAESIEKVYKG